MMTALAATTAAMPMHLRPTQYKPLRPDMLIGQRTQALASGLMASASAYKDQGQGNIRILLHGDSGLGKTAICEMVALHLAESPAAIELVNGCDVTVEKVREWQVNLHHSIIFGNGWRVIIINEIDYITERGGVLMLSLLESLPPRRAIFATTNKSLNVFEDRFQSRFQAIEVRSPEASEIQSFIRGTWNIPAGDAQRIVAGGKRNVRTILSDTDSYLLFR